MNLFLLLPEIAFLVNTLVIVYILAQKRKNRVSRAYINYSLNLAFWVLCVIIIRGNPQNTFILPLLKLASISWLLIGLLFLNFTYEFISKSRDWIFYTFGIATVIAIAVSVITEFVISGYTYYYWGAAATYGILFLPFVILLIIMPVLYSLFLMLKHISNSQSTIIQKTVPLIVTGTVISLLILFVSNVFLPDIMGMKDHFIFAESTSVVQSIFVFIAVYKYGLFGFSIEELSYNLFKLMNDGVVVQDWSGRIIHVNKSTEKIFGIASGTILNKKIKTFFTEAAKPGNNDDNEYVIDCNGEQKYLSVSSNKIYQSGEDIGSLTLLKDITASKINEQQLIESEATFSELFNYSPDALIVVDSNGTVTRVNKQVEKVFGYSSYELIGKNISLLIPERFHQSHEKHVEKFSEETSNRKMGEGLELYGLHKDGHEFMIDVMLSPITRSNRKYILATVRDITELRSKEKKLRESEEQYKNIIHTLPYGIVEMDTSGTIRLINSEFAELHGLDPENIIGSKIWEVGVLPEDAEAIKEFVSSASRGELEPETEFVRRVKTNGSRIDIQIDWNYIKDAEGNITGFISIYTDITEKLSIEKNLQKNRLMLSQAEQLSHLGSWEWDIGENRLYWSGELYRIFGVNREEFSPTFEQFTNRIHPDDKDRVLNTINDSIKYARPFFHLEKIVKPDGEVRTLSTRGMVQTNSKNEVVKMYGSCLDVTDFKKIENDLIKSQKQLRALSANLQSSREEERTHIAREIHDELGQVLTAINMDIVLMIDELEEGNKLSEDSLLSSLKSIEELINRLIKSVQDISTELRPDVIDHLGLSAALEWYLKEFSRRYKIEYDLKKSVDKVHVEDSTKLNIFRIFQEALTNVARHSKATKVEVEIIKTKSRFEFKLVDNGIGIDDEKLEDIKSTGIIGIKERVLLINGNIIIKRGERGGTMLYLKVPLSN